jgi:hypothetical protein
MQKALEQLAAGDFVLLNDPTAPLALSRPLRVTGLAGPRVYVEDPNKPRRYVARTSIRLVLVSEEAANAVFSFGRQNVTDYDDRARALKAEHRARLSAFLANLGTPCEGALPLQH